MALEMSASRKYKVSQPVFPDGYIPPHSETRLLPFSFVDEHMQAARNYWVSSTRPDGRPHAMPVWGVWLDGLFYFEGSPQTRRVRNILQNPAVVVHLEDGTQVVIIEGAARGIVKPDRELAQKLSQVYSAKYDWADYHPEPNAWDGGGLCVVLPKVIFAWSRFPEDTTRWVLVE